MTIDAHAMLDLMRSQLNWLEGEMLMLRKTLGASTPKMVEPPPFESLRGIWANVTFSEEDIRASRLEFSSGL